MSQAASARVGPSETPETTTPCHQCPECGRALPAEGTICPACMCLLPFSPQAAQPATTGAERKQVRVNLLPYHLRWDPAGLDRARQLIQRAIDPLLSEGWLLLTPVEGSGIFVQGRSIGGPVVQGALLTLQRHG